MDNVKLNADVLGLSRLAAGAVGAPLRLDQYANLKIHDVLRGLEFQRTHRTFAANSGTATMIAPVTALPTTAAAHILYNSAASRRYLWVRRAYTWLNSGTPTAYGSILTCVTPDELATAPAAESGSLNKSADGKGGPAAAGVYDTNATIVAPVWNFHPKDRMAAAAITFTCWEVRPPREGGGWLIPPKHGFCLTHLDSGAGTTPLYGAGFEWDEFDLDSND